MTNTFIGSAEELTHYGVKGMKWGVRRGSSASGGKKARRKRSDDDASDYKDVKALRKKSPRKLSNDELKKLNTRMGLERQYDDLRRSTSEVGRGRAAVNNQLQTAMIINTVATIATGSAALLGYRLVTGRNILGQKPPKND